MKLINMITRKRMIRPVNDLYLQVHYKDLHNISNKLNIDFENLRRRNYIWLLRRNYIWLLREVNPIFNFLHTDLRSICKKIK